jgi:hypothetical protein
MTRFIFNLCIENFIHPLTMCTEMISSVGGGGGTDLSVERPVPAAAESVSLVPIIGAVLAALALILVLIDLSCCRLNNAGTWLSVS